MRGAFHPVDFHDGRPNVRTDHFRGVWMDGLIQFPLDDQKRLTDLLQPGLDVILELQQLDHAAQRVHAVPLPQFAAFVQVGFGEPGVITRSRVRWRPGR